MTDAYTAPTPAQMSSVPAAATQPSATDRLEALLKQLQEEQMAPPVAVESSAVQSSFVTPAGGGTNTADFAAVLSQVPPMSAAVPQAETPTVLNSLDEVIRTIGEKYADGQPDLPELLATARETTTNTLSVESMTFVKPQNGISPSTTAPSTEQPKLTVMPAPAPVPTPAEPASEMGAAPPPRVLTQYLRNLAGHMKLYGQLNLSHYAKLSATR